MRNNSRRPGVGKKFWNKEYKTGEHLALSTEPSEDLQKFTRFLVREYGHEYLNQTASVLDVGTGNGRNLSFLARDFGVRGMGYDISEEAIAQARKGSEGLPVAYEVRSIKDPIPLPDGSETIVLDMMASHVLREAERAALRTEIARVLKPGGWLFFKTFLLDDDPNAKRMIRDYPAGEQGSYIHPEIGVPEHAYTEEEAVNALSEYFDIVKIYKSHGHLRKSGPKRRSIVIYARKKEGL